MKNNTEEKTPHQVLLENLNDETFADNFSIVKLEQTIRDLDAILIVTSGVASTRNLDHDFGHELLYNLLSLFQIRHPNFDRSTFAERLQSHVFSTTMAHSNAYSVWADKIEQDFYDGVYDAAPTEETSEPETAPTIENDISKRDKFFYQIWANKIAHVLESKDVSEDTKNAIKGVLTAIANESNGGLYDEPEVVRVGFPLQMQMLNFAERRAFKLAIDNIFDCSIDSAVLDELEQYDISFPLQENEESAPLDLSALSADELNSNDTKDNKHFAKCLSEIITDSSVPAELRDSIMNGLTEVYNHGLFDQGALKAYEHSPEYIEKLLDLAGGENE